jgi:MFS family permease
LFFASFNMLLPELSSYLTSLGGAEYKGLIVSVFTLTAMTSRPYSGKIADKVGRVPVIMFGSIVCCICSFIYPLLTTVSGFLLLRLVHGFSTGFTPTGQTAYLSDIIPAHKRGEAMGLLGTAGSVGMAGGPALGGTLSNAYGINVMFYCSSALAILALMILSKLKETVKAKQKFNASVLKISKADLFEPRVLAPCVVMALCAYAYGASFTILPDMSDFLGIKNKGIIFTFLTVASLLVRLLGGKASDRWGRKPVLRVSITFIVAGMAIIAVATTPLLLIIGVIVYGLGQGSTSPTLLAWATDLSDTNHKGRGIGSLYIFMELGIGLGAFISGLLYSNQTSNFFLTFIVSSIFACIGFFYLLAERSSVRLEEVKVKV